TNISTGSNTIVTSSSQIVKVNELQRGNPLLACIRNVRWTYSRDIESDFEVGRNSSLYYLSIKYHRLHPEYISKRIEKSKNYKKILLLFVDTEDSKIPLREINRFALLNDITLLLAWSLDEAGRYIESLKVLEYRPIIRERIEDNFMAKFTHSLTSIRSVNKTDVLTLANNFKSFKGISKSTVEELTLCPGVGDLKARRIFKAFNEPFITE
ncbi:DNA repair protein rad10, partial [Coemansia reversa NRRL 1564]